MTFDATRQQKEINLVKARKDSCLAAWQARQPSNPQTPNFNTPNPQLQNPKPLTQTPLTQAHSDTAVVKQLLASCEFHLSRVEAFLLDVLACAHVGNALHSCRIKV
jgi:hypothetical protein